MLSTQEIIKRSYLKSVASTEKSIQSLGGSHLRFGFPVSGDELTLLNLKRKEG